MVRIYDTEQEKVITLKFEEYIKGVVAAEVPAGFDMEAIKAQAIAARSFSIYRLKKYKNGHPDHPQAALCTSIHCQAYISKDELREVKGSYRAIISLNKWRDDREFRRCFCKFTTIFKGGGKPL